METREVYLEKDETESESKECLINEIAEAYKIDTQKANDIVELIDKHCDNINNSLEPYVDSYLICSTIITSVMQTLLLEWLRASQVTVPMDDIIEDLNKAFSFPCNKSGISVKFTKDKKGFN